MDKPDSRNGTVLLYSHGHTPAGLPNPARNAPDDATKSLLLKDGYALIGSSYASNGWAVTDAVPDQLATLDAFAPYFGPARRTIARGTSYGGLVTAMIAERHPDRISGSLSMCGLLQGGVAGWNNTLDPVVALKTLLHRTRTRRRAVRRLHDLETRMTTGHRRGTESAALNARAAQDDPAVPARCVRHHPAPFPRPYDLAHPADRYRP